MNPGHDFPHSLKVEWKAIIEDPPYAFKADHGQAAVSELCRREQG